VIFRSPLTAVVTVLEERTVSAADRAAGVTRQAWVRLGARAGHQSPRMRLVWVQADGHSLRLVTHRPPTELPAELVALLYRRCWQIERFFRWIKCLLGCRHWLAESPEGVPLQLYLALIAALLLQLYTGQRPNRRMLELIQFYLSGVATLDELIAGLERERAAGARRAKKAA
jgi:IS4 transposase